MATMLPAWLLMLAVGSPLSWPLSLPPLPADPVISNVAPEQCLWYMSLAGVDRANPASKNQVEQLLAEEDVRAFTKQLISKLKAAIAASLSTDPARKALGEEGPQLIETLLTRPMCVYIGSIVPGAHGPMVRGGMVVNLGESPAATEASLKKVLDLIAPDKSGAVSAPGADLASDGWLTLSLPPDAPIVQWGIRDQYLVVGVGEGEAAAVWARRQKAAPPWLTELQAKLQVERPSMVQYVNLQVVEGMAQMALTVVEGPENAKDTLDTLGLTNAQYFASVCGLDEHDFISRTIIATVGPPLGLLALLDGKPLDAQVLHAIPADCTFAVVASVQPVKIVDALMDIMVAITPREQLVGPQPNEQKTRDILNRQLDTLAVGLGFHPKNDVAASLGDTWCIYNSPSEGGLIVTGLTVTGTLKDRPKLMKSNDQLLAAVRQQQALLQAMMQNNPAIVVSMGPTIADCQYRGQKIYFLNFGQAASPVAPAWCITDDHFVFGLFPQTIKAYLDRQAAAGSAAKQESSPGIGRSSLADNPEVVAQFSGATSPQMISYADAPNLFKLTYPLLQISAQYGFSGLQASGIDLNISALPSASSVLPHLRPSVTQITSSNHGIQIESHGSLPNGPFNLVPLAALFGFRSAAMAPAPRPAVNAIGVGNLNFLAVPKGAVVPPLPPLVFAPGPAGDRAHSISNLKQIALAMINILAARKTYPPAFTVDQDKKPLLSWRVMILPFLEQGELYRQFKLDEPWDSENNKKLIGKMPAVFAAPGSKAAREFKTVYLTPRGDNTVFPGEKPIRARDILDGLSQTIMVVEAADAQAVIWTKPDDFDVNQKDPIAGLVGLHEGGFLSAFCDGAIHSVTKSVDAQTLMNLFNRADGNRIDNSMIQTQPAGAVQVQPFFAPVAPPAPAPAR